MVRPGGWRACGLTCFIRSFRWPAVYDGGSHSSSRSIFMNSSTVSWLVGVSSNSVSLEQRWERDLTPLKSHLNQHPVYKHPQAVWGPWPSAGLLKASTGPEPSSVLATAQT